MARRSVPARLYRGCLGLLPPGLRRDADEMADVLDQLWRERAGAGGGARLMLRAFGRLPAVLAAEWAEALGFTTKSTGGWEMTGWGRHFGVALRTLRKAPAFSVTSIGLIGLGVGAVTTIFTLVDHVLLRPLPYPAADRLVTVQNGSHSGLSFEGFTEIEGFEQWAASRVETGNLTGEGDPIRVDYAQVSEDFFSILGARPVLGRLFVREDFVAPSVVVVSHDAWRTIFGEDPDIVGRTVRLDAKSYTVLGVLDAAFERPRNMVSQDVAFYAPIDWSEEELQRAGYRVLETVGRLEPGVTAAALQPRFDELAERLANLYPDEMKDRSGEWESMPLAELQASTVEDVRSGLYLLFGAVGLLLVVACLNVAHLFLARGIGRVREMAVRRALGAGAGGLVQQLLVESVVVGALGGALGLALARVGLDAMLALNPEALPTAGAITLDLRVAGFAAAVSLLTAVFFGLLPALRTVGADLADALRSGSRSATDGRSTQRLRSGLVVAEVALSLVLVAQAGLLLRSFAQVQAHDPRFSPEGVWTVPLTPTQYETPDAYQQAMDRVVASLAALPGVEHAAYGLTQPFEFAGPGRCCWRRGGQEIDGELREDLRFMIHPVSTDYFATLGTRLVAGSIWSEGDVGDPPYPGVITERAAIDLFGSAERALGHTVGNGGLRVNVVGVAPDIRHYGLDQPEEPSMYVPMDVVPFTIPMAHMAVRVRGDAPDGLARTLREAVWAVEPDMPVPTVRAMDDWIDESLSGRRFDSAVYGAFGAVALLLAAAGLYGTLLYSVRQRSRELGIRMALGAARARVERQVVARGLRLALGGAILGIGGAAWLGRRLEERLYEVQASDPLALGSAAGVLLLTAVLASWIPARRAGRVDPLETLRAE